MKQHPSLETLTAYFDRELPPSDLPTLDRHLGDCPECRAHIEAFTAMNELGPVVDESLPGPSYWEDLPDRVWIRIQAEAIPTPRAVGEPWWRRVLPHRLSWRWGVASLATAAAAAAVVLMTGDGTQRVRYEDSLALKAPDSHKTASLLERLSDPRAKPDPSLTPDSYTNTAQRVIQTLGGDEADLGTTLDLIPGQEVASGSAGSGVVDQVSQSPLDMPLRGEIAEAVPYGCDTPSVEKAFLIATQAEQANRPDLAALGYALVRANVSPNDPLYAEAHYRLNRLAWQFRMQQVAGIERARMMAKLHKQAVQRYQTWLDSQGDQDCREAWCLNRVLFNLSGDMAPKTEVTQIQARVSNLEDCLKR